HAPAAALLRARVEPGRERVGVPAAEQAQPSRLAGLRRDRRDLPRRLELAGGGARPARLDHPPRVGETGHQLRPLVLLAALVAEREAAQALMAKAEARADRLEAALAEARRPWLARVIDGLRRKGS